MIELPLPFVQHHEAMIVLCEKFGVDKLYVFGSVAKNQFNSKSSDIDLLVEMEPMPPIERGENLMSLWDAFEYLFARKVDLLTDQPIRNPYLRQNIEETKRLIYDRKRTEVPF
ncbi:nucleotidyltransferase family protein [Persicitalea sp.]|uniref:nucleotidyltransferase family protein n=1 Tax=Persicitalea sp. TaxID=3100273 RepID=UPI003593688D